MNQPKPPKTKVKTVEFQTGFFLEPIIETHYIEVPLTPKRRKR